MNKKSKTNKLNKNNNKKQLIVLIVIIFIVIVAMALAVYFMTHSDDTTKNEKEEFITEANDNSAVIEEKEVSGLKISNVMLVVKEEGSTFTADVTNTTDNEITGTLDIIFKTSTDKEVTSILGYFGESIKPGETKQISSNTSRQLNKNIVKSVDYVLNTEG